MQIYLRQNCLLIVLLHCRTNKMITSNTKKHHFPRRQLTFISIKLFTVHSSTKFDKDALYRALHTEEIIKRMRYSFDR